MANKERLKAILDQMTVIDVDGHFEIDFEFDGGGCADMLLTNMTGDNGHLYISVSLNLDTIQQLRRELKLASLYLIECADELGE